MPELKENTAIMKMRVIWPKVFEDYNYEYPQKDQKEMAVADGLMGWGLCYAGNQKPANFGRGMVKIDKIIGVAATPENLHKLADDILGK